ncbi:MAG: hypothetical protein E7629_08315, partial [Ruminococcaceae bacterium]|nr:hypothetical protein [Oscillospiraceae bacterium]
MEFYTPKGLTRPIRLCDSTRKFAYESLNHKYGLDTRKTMAIALDDIDEATFSSLTKLEKYDLSIERIVKEAPLRICEDERLSGAATLGNGIHHRVPTTYGGKTVINSVSHLTVDFETVLKRGTKGIRKDAEESLARYAGTDREPFLRSCIHCLDCMDLWHARYLEALAERPEYADNYKNLQVVPKNPATNFYEAVQSIWFTFAFLRLCGNWPGIGRIDWLLGDYLKKDLAEGSITMEEAREILAHLFIKGCEWVYGEGYNHTGDAQHYQNILLSGIDSDGNDVTNEVSYLVLDVLEELGISDFPTSVRLNKNTDEKFLARVAEVMRFGGGILAVYNEETVIEALLKDGYPLEAARRFANDGCWEVQVPGETFFAYIPFDSLAALQQKTLKGYAEEVTFVDFEELYQDYINALRPTIEEVTRPRREKCNQRGANGEWIWKEQPPCTAVSLFERGCIAKGRSYFEGGPNYNIISPHIGGLADTVNALYAIKKLVFDEKKLSLNAFLEILKNNWEGEEALRQYVLTHYSYYGNDNDEVDGICARLLSDFADLCKELDGTCAYHFPAGVSTFGRQIEWSPKRLAAPHGRRAGEILAGNSSPTPGTDKEGATAIVSSYCKADFTKLATGAALDLKLLPSSVRGDDGLQALIALLRGLVVLEGFFMQPDV